MFLRSLLQRKHKKDQEGVIPLKPPSGGRKQKGTKEVSRITKSEEVGPGNNDGNQTRDTPDIEAVEGNKVLDVSEGEPPSPVPDNIQQNDLNGDIVNPGLGGGTVENPPPPPLPSSPPPEQEDQDEFTTPTSGICEEMSPAEEPRSKVFVGQQGDGTFGDEGLVKLAHATDNASDESNSEDEGFSGSDSQIEEFIKDVIATVSLELRRESSLAVNDVEPSVEDNSGTHCDDGSRLTAKNTDERFVVGDAEIRHQSASFDHAALMNNGEEERLRLPRVAPGNHTIESIGTYSKLEESSTRDECQGSIADESAALPAPAAAANEEAVGENTGAPVTSFLSSGRETSLEKQGSILPDGDTGEQFSASKPADNFDGDCSSGMANSDVSTVGGNVEHGTADSGRCLPRGCSVPRDSDIPLGELQPLYTPSASGGSMDNARSKSRSSNVLACRFYMDDESKEFPNVTSSPFQPGRGGVGAFYDDYSDRRYARMGRTPEITPIRYEDGSYEYPPQGSQGNYSMGDQGNTPGDLSSTGAYVSRDWSRIEDVTDSPTCDFDDFETSDTYEVFVPRPPLDEFVITPCDDSDSDDGEEFLADATADDGATATAKVIEGTKYSASKLNPVAKEWTGGDQYAFQTKGEIGIDDAVMTTPSPTEGEMSSQQTTEEKKQELKNWGKFREDNLDRALRTILSKLDSRIERLPENVRDQVVELRSKIADAIDLERPMEASASTEDEGEISLMDTRVSSAMEQQASLALSLKTTEERTRIMETQLEQFEAEEADRKKGVVSLRAEVEEATARQRSLTVMLSEERRLKEALQLRLASMTQEKQQLLYNNVMLWEQTSQLELKQEHSQGVSDQEKRDLEAQMRALEAELIELRSRRAGEPVTKISVESACSTPSDQNLTTPNGARGVDGDGEQGGGYGTPRHGRYGPPPPGHPPPPPPDFDNEGEFYPPYPPYQGPYRHNANNSGFPFPPRGRGYPPPRFLRRGYPRRRGDNLTVYFDRLSNGSPMTWYPSNSQEFQSPPRGGGRRPFPRRGRGRGYGRGRRGRFHREDLQK